MDYKIKNSFGRFLFVGLSNMVISFLTFILLSNLLSNITGKSTIAQAFSYSIGIVWSFLLNKNWTFQSRGSAFSESYRFIILQLSLLVFSTILIGALVDWLHFPRIISWLTVMSFVTIVNYISMKFWVFKKVVY